MSLAVQRRLRQRLRNCESLPREVMRLDLAIEISARKTSDPASLIFVRGAMAFGRFV
jgi:hypothetical protein